MHLAPASIVETGAAARTRYREGNPQRRHGR